jgi:hypothetical protein
MDEQGIEQENEKNVELMNESNDKKDEVNDDSDFSDNISEGNDDDDENEPSSMFEAYSSDESNNDAVDTSSSDEDEENNNEFVKELLKQLLSVNKIKKREDMKKNKQFIPSIKKYLKYDMKTRGQKLTPKITRNLKFLASSILNGKIPVSIDHSDRRTLRHILSNKTHALDKKLVLVEDYRLHSCFKEAIRIIEKNLKGEEKNGRIRKQATTD